ncbi:hypothetical protein [Coralliovum pocilloporae]|uniref:hypothetical protein n=1 Tax=Coralliovum pocilloporae TaxID=3066369 RepID=UPI00330778AC
MYRTLPAAALLLGFLGPQQTASASDPHYEIELVGRKTVFNTETGMLTIKGITRPGLVSVIRRRNEVLLRYWENGSFRETVELNGELLVDGKDMNDISRVSGFKMDRGGSYVYLHMTKGPEARVQLFQDGTAVLDWPRDALIRVISYSRQSLVLGSQDRQTGGMEFLAYSRNQDGSLSRTPTRLGSLNTCLFMAAKPYGNGLAIQAFCGMKTGNDILYFDFETGNTIVLANDPADEILGALPSPDRTGIQVVHLSGNRNGLTAFHAVSGIFLSSLGEPFSRSSDEAGRQSWGQAYRTRVLGVLAGKTEHPVFAVLARMAVRQTLGQTNRTTGIAGNVNPGCAWASRIYSDDRRTPISFLVNQAMISAGMIEACDALGGHCPSALKQEILHNAQCLVRAYESNFDAATGLYRIPYGVNFRFDGIWAPWNWHMSWAPVLEHVGKAFNEPYLTDRASRLSSAFLTSWTRSEAGALWHYWPEEFYKGWTLDMGVSKSRPTQKQHVPRRFEDTSHAGISLIGLNGLSTSLPNDLKTPLKKTLDRLLPSDLNTPRDLDGQGPRGPRWLPGAGFDAYATERFREFYSRKLPGGVSTDQHLAYANLVDVSQPVTVNLKQLICHLDGCERINAWQMNSLTDLVENNPYFTIKELP